MADQGGDYMNLAYAPNGKRVMAYEYDSGNSKPTDGVIVWREP